MKFWLLRSIQAAGLVLLLVALSSALFPPAPAAPDGIQLNLALRQIGHNYLREVGDSTSMIPPIQHAADGSHLLLLEANIAYDTLIRVASKILSELNYTKEYSITLEDTSNGEIFLGSLSRAVFGDTTLNDMLTSCTGRDQEIRYANVRFSFHEPTADAGNQHILLFSGLGLLCLLVLPVSRRFTGKEVIEPTNNPELLSLGANASLNEATQTLRIGKVDHQLTYRESKLLAYLAANPNEILERMTIHDAVWGEEGLITGRSLDVFVSRLRKKIASVEDIEIRTAHGVGYQFLVK